jgi:outer membrane protein assembly factor BamA
VVLLKLMGMLLHKRLIPLLVGSMLLGSEVQAQVLDSLISPNPGYTVTEIIITGNKKTRREIIERELTFTIGETYAPEVLVKKMEMGQHQLMNTTLFNYVTVAVHEYLGYNVRIEVTVKERWYLFPVPYFRPVDRNLNQWLVEQKGSISRVNYGVKFTYNNATGRNDKLKAWLINGYTKQVSLSYDRLYIDKNLKWGAATSFVYGKNREINYNTVNDKQVFLKDPGVYLRKFASGHFGFSYRPAIRTRHSFGVGFSFEEVSDTVVALNPGYFDNERTRIGYPSIYYTLSYFDLDYIPYPTKGFALQFSVSKNGLNRHINLWQFHVKALGNWQVLPKTFFHLNTYGGIKAPFKQPYFNRRFLGYGDMFMQGYEYYVIDGVAGGYLKSTISRELVNLNIRVPRGKKKEPTYIPFRLFGKVYGNTGYVYNPQQEENSLSNQMLYSGGVGLDIITLYDVVVRLEWSFNQLGQNGLFLHRKTIF